jgi:5-methylthioadenosine/S-adenosylhomocysteine deaminase
MAFFREETSRQPHLRTMAVTGAEPRRFVLRGRIVTMNDADDVIEDGFVCIEGDIIAHVGAWSGGLPSPFEAGPIIPTHGTIYPGLIELHNHPAYNVIPMWPVPQHFDNRTLWRDHPSYKRWVKNTDMLLCNHPVADYPKALVRFAECRALLGGVTTTQGILFKSGADITTYFEGLVRNVEYPVKDWPVADDYVNDLKTKKEAKDALSQPIAAGTPFIIHLCEGIDAGTRAYFDNLHKEDGSWLIAPSLIAIHATALEASDFAILAQQGLGGIVWSPLSNMLLYGATTKVAEAKKAGVPIAIGSDWAPSGTKNLLGELKIAKHVSDHGGGVFTNKELVAAVTRVPATMLGWASHVGRIAPGKTADILVLDKVGGDPYCNLIDADESNVVAVIIDGRPRVGRGIIIDPSTPGVELLHIAQQDLVLDIVEANGHPLGGFTLGNAIAKMTQALANLPEVAKDAQGLAPLMKGITEAWRPVPDYDRDPAMPLFQPRPCRDRMTSML